MAKAIQATDVYCFAETNTSRGLNVAQLVAKHKSTCPWVWDLGQEFHIYQKHSSKHAGGCLTVFVRKTLPHKCVLDADVDLDIILVHTNDVTIIAVYIPPQAPQRRGGDLPGREDLWRSTSRSESKREPHVRRDCQRG